MGTDQNRITGHKEITGLGCDEERLIGKTVTVFTIDGNAVSGEVLTADHIAIYVKEGEESTRAIKTSAIASISMSTEDAKRLMVKENESHMLPLNFAGETKKPGWK